MTSTIWFRAPVSFRSSQYYLRFDGDHRTRSRYTKAPFRWEPRQPEPDDPMFGKLHVVSVNAPKVDRR